MSMNLAPLVDLFSILAIGLLLIMTVTAGTESPSPKKPTYSIARFYLGKPDSVEKKYPGISMGSLIQIDPYFLVDGSERAVEDLDVRVDVTREPDSITTMIRGVQDNLDIGYRVTRVVNPEMMLMTFSTSLVLISSNANEGEDDVVDRTIGMWIDPVASVF